MIVLKFNLVYICCNKIIKSNRKLNIKETCVQIERMRLRKLFIYFDYFINLVGIQNFIYINVFSFGFCFDIQGNVEKKLFLIVFF